MAVKSLAQSSLLQPSGINSMLGDHEGNYFHHLETVRLSSSATVFELTNLGQYSDYQHLQIRCVFRNTQNAGTGGLNTRFNSDSGTNYSYHVMQGNGSSFSASAGTGQSYATLGWIPHASTASGAFSSTIVDLVDPFSTSKVKTWRSLSGSLAYSNIVGLWSGAWFNTNALSSISFIADGSNSFASGCRVSLYGIKARS